MTNDDQQNASVDGKIFLRNSLHLFTTFTLHTHTHAIRFSQNMLKECNFQWLVPTVSIDGHNAKIRMAKS